MFLRLAYFLFRIYCFFFRPVRLGVRILITKQGQVLLVRQTYMPGWFMPGGAIQRGETLEQAARREAREEVGAELGSLRLLGTYSNFKEWKSDHNVVFAAEDVTFTAVQDHEVAEARFFSLDDLPKALWPGHRRRLEELRAGKQSPLYGEW
jgi:8-oxo-dGTP pyrophosphatase MutT (NUDIX family)